MPYRTVDLADRRFGKLTAIKPTDKRSSGKIVWECLCDCGRTTFVQSAHLTNGHTQSCGCIRGDIQITHGCTHTRLYRIWASMKTRCTNPNSKTFDYYGGRGIGICSEWLDDFTEFYRWAVANGYDDCLTLDRKDGDGNYEPGNCRWATWHEQRVNQRRCKQFV